MGGGLINDFMDHIGHVGDLKHEKGMKEAVVELKSLINGHRMGSNSAGNSEIPGSLVGRVTKTLIYDKRRNRKQIRKLGR